MRLPLRSSEILIDRLNQRIKSSLFLTVTRHTRRDTLVAQKRLLQSDHWARTVYEPPDTFNSRFPPQAIEVSDDPFKFCDMRRVAVIVNSVEGYARGVLRGVMPFAFSRDWQCNVVGVGLSNVSDNPSDFDGIIVQIGSEKEVDKFGSAGVAVVNVSSSMQVDSMPSVVCDDIAVGRLGAEYFLRRGFRYFGWYSPLDRRFAILRQQGFAARLAERGFEPVIAINRTTLASTVSSLGRPGAIMCCNDVSALEVLEQCRASKLKVPDEVAVLGVDNDDLIQSLASPPLSSIGTATEQIGFEAAALLERLMDRLPAAMSDKILISPTGIITRRSTDLTAIADVEVAEALRFIREHATGPIGVGDVLQSVSVSRRQLERRFQAALGRSMLEEIRRCRMERARQLLLETDLTIPQVATASGFSSASYMTVVLSAMAGQTPGKLRKIRSNANS
jgi:LacI family transcriptional regulator